MIINVIGAFIVLIFELVSKLEVYVPFMTASCRYGGFEPKNSIVYQLKQIMKPDQITKDCTYMDYFLDDNYYFKKNWQNALYVKLVHYNGLHIILIDKYDYLTVFKSLDSDILDENFYAYSTKYHYQLEYEVKLDDIDDLWFDVQNNFVLISSHNKYLLDIQTMKIIEFTKSMIVLSDHNFLVYQKNENVLLLSNWFQDYMFMGFYTGKFNEKNVPTFRIMKQYDITLHIPINTQGDYGEFTSQFITCSIDIQPKKVFLLINFHQMNIQIGHSSSTELMREDITEKYNYGFIVNPQKIFKYGYGEGNVYLIVANHYEYLIRGADRYTLHNINRINNNRIKNILAIQVKRNFILFQTIDKSKHYFFMNITDSNQRDFGAVKIDDSKWFNNPIDHVPMQTLNNLEIYIVTSQGDIMVNYLQTPQIVYIYGLLYGKLDEVARLRYSSSVFMGICTIVFLIYKIIS